MAGGASPAVVENDTTYGFEANEAFVVTGCGKAWLEKGRLDLAIHAAGNSQACWSLALSGW